MLFALIVMAGVLLLAIFVNNRRESSRWEGRRSGWDDGNTGDGSAWAFGGDSGGDCGADGGGGGCDGGGGGGD